MNKKTFQVFAFVKIDFSVAALHRNDKAPKY